MKMVKVQVRYILDLQGLDILVDEMNGGTANFWF